MERLRVAWAAAVGAAIGILVTEFFYGTKGIRNWGWLEWQSSLLGGGLFYLSTPIREAFVARPLRHWLQVEEMTPAAFLSIHGRFRLSIVNGIIGFVAFGLVDILNHMFVAGVDRSVRQGIAFLPIPLLMTYSWAYGVSTGRAYAAVRYGVLGGAFGILLGAFFEEWILELAKAQRRLHEAMWSRNGELAAIVALAVYLFARRRGYSTIIAAGWAAIAGIGAGFAAYLDIWHSNSGGAGLMLVFLGVIGGLVIYRSRHAPRVNLGLAIIVLFSPLFLIPHPSQQNPDIGIRLMILLFTLAAIAWGFPFKRVGLGAAISVASVIGGLITLTKLHVRALIDIEFLIMSTGWALGLILHPLSDKVLTRPGQPSELDTRPNASTVSSRPIEWTPSDIG